MDALIIRRTSDTPSIIFNPAKGIFKFEGRSLPEDATLFFEPVFAWLNTYMQNPDPQVKFVFNLENINTTSAKQISKILVYIEKVAHPNSVSITWKYKDEDMYAIGVRFAQLLVLKFDLIEE